MDKKNKWIFIILTYVLLIWTICGIIKDNKEHIEIIMILVSSIFILQTILIIFETLKNNQKIFNINLIIQIIIIILILFLDKGSSSQGFIFIILGYSVIVFNTKISIGILGISYLVYSLSRYYVGYNHSQYGITYERLINFGINLVFMYIMFFLAKHEITQKEIIKEKNNEIQKAYDKLQESFDLMEENTILRERNRIAGEIHDIVGHTLTTVLIEIEAGKRLIDKNVEKSKETLSSAQEQVRKGLNEIRASVKCISSGQEYSFMDILKTIISDTEKHAGVKVDSNIGEIPTISKEIEKTFIRALQEGLTNGIKHGNSKNFNFSLQFNNNEIQFYLKSDGIGTDNVNYGFGLSNIKNKVENSGGSLEVKSGVNDGFSIIINIPKCSLTTF